MEQHVRLRAGALSLETLERRARAPLSRRRSSAGLGCIIDTVDLADAPVTVPGWTYVQVDARAFSTKVTYDTVFSTSTLEHIGLGNCGDRA